MTTLTETERDTANRNANELEQVARMLGRITDGSVPGVLLSARVDEAYRFAARACGEIAELYHALRARDRGES